MDKARGRKLPFVNKLLEILNRHEFNDIIHWDKDGTAIVVEQVLQFESLILPKYFDSSRMDSFSRQLNIYGFKRISDSRKQKSKPSERTSAFHNPNFIRNRPELLQNIIRQKNPRKAQKPVSSSTSLTTTPQMPETSTFGLNSPPNPTAMLDTPTSFQPIPFYYNQPFFTNPCYPTDLPTPLYAYPYPQ
ncbi:hypothetical protein L0F63_004240, partial [Massospora cicadina]